LINSFRFIGRLWCLCWISLSFYKEIANSFLIVSPIVILLLVVETASTWNDAAAFFLFLFLGFSSL
jgi:hypothetical protein